MVTILMFPLSVTWIWFLLCMQQAPRVYLSRYKVIIKKWPSRTLCLVAPAQIIHSNFRRSNFMFNIPFMWSVSECPQIELIFTYLINSIWNTRWLWIVCVFFLWVLSDILSNHLLCDGCFRKQNNLFQKYRADTWYTVTMA